MTGHLQGKAVIVTGASRGIGRAIVHCFAREGAKLVLVARQEEHLRAVQAELVGVMDQTRIVVGDVRHERVAARAVDDALDHFGTLDILVNNAGIAIHKPLIDLTPAEYDDVMNTNMRATFLFSRAVVPVFLERGHGCIINIGSGAGTRGIATESAYCASKFAQRGFALALDQELRSKNIRTSIILPGNVDTDFNDQIPTEIGTSTPRDRMIPEDVARAALFVASQNGNAHVVELVVRPLIDAT